LGRGGLLRATESREYTATHDLVFVMFVFLAFGSYVAAIPNGGNDLMLDAASRDCFGGDYVGQWRAAAYSTSPSGAPGRIIYLGDPGVGLVRVLVGWVRGKIH
jgi:hypothetical protein